MYKAKGPESTPTTHTQIAVHKHADGCRRLRAATYDTVLAHTDRASKTWPDADGASHCKPFTLHPARPRLVGSTQSQHQTGAAAAPGLSGRHQCLHSRTAGEQCVFFPANR